MDLIIELLCAKLPRELVNKIIYEFGGVESPVAGTIKFLYKNLPGDSDYDFGKRNMLWLNREYGKMQDFGFRRKSLVDKIFIMAKHYEDRGVTFPANAPFAFTHSICNIIERYVSLMEYPHLDPFFIFNLVHLMQPDATHTFDILEDIQRLVNDDLDHQRLCILRNKYNIIESPYRAKELLDKVSGYQSDKNISSRLRTVWTTGLGKNDSSIHAVRH